MTEPPILLDHQTTIVVENEQGKHYIIIDKDKEEMLSKYSWYISPQGYASTSFLDENQNNHRISMHRMLMKGRIVDHIDRNRINNSMKNLRSSTRSLNSFNTPNRINSGSKYRGVAIQKKYNRFMCMVYGKYVGTFDDELSAAYRYNEYILEHYKDHQGLMSNLNDVEKPAHYITPKQKGEILPKGISRRGRKYIVKVYYEKKCQYLSFSTKGEAIKKCEERRREIAKKYEEKIDNLPITRNSDGIAVVRLNKWSSNMDDETKKKHECLVDDDKWHMLMKLGKWCKLNGYVINTTHGLIHRILMNCTAEDEEYVVDHRNNNELDNRLQNLRKVHRKTSYNNHNRRKKSGTSSIYRGVCFEKNRKLWASQIKFQKKRTNIGLYNTQIDAARAYDEKVAEFYGSEGTFNFPLPDPITQKLLENRKVLGVKRTREEHEQVSENNVKRTKTQ